ncbi:MAG TPA: 50S ribosomal protein L35 [Coxiellaceae bacterium]|nr:MAG: 50S ribosomal protein L35 [Gammaproteobacteria bacterium RBG_16_37_9]HBC71987.1 50S ribosomal protein L35 [Coxiellaceae bacterium]HBY56076.1 50S ribosomal protein L35 [Coxiellaceae bacterium]
MPKMKTNKSAKKRFKKTASGAYKHRSSFRNHILTKKKSKRKARLASGGVVSKRDHKAVKRMLKD